MMVTKNGSIERVCPGNKKGQCAGFLEEEPGKRRDLSSRGERREERGERRGSVRHCVAASLRHCIGIAQAMTPIAPPPSTMNGAGTLSTSEKPKQAIPMQMDVARNGEEMYALVPRMKTLEMMRPTAAWQRGGGWRVRGRRGRGGLQARRWVSTYRVEPWQSRAV
jgi:hypothetical protein